MKVMKRVIMPTFAYDVCMCCWALLLCVSQLMAPCLISCSRPCCLWWSTACAAAVTGGASTSRAPWSVQEETSYLAAMCVRQQKKKSTCTCQKWTTCCEQGQLLYTVLLFPCQGDSGGPLNCVGQDGRWYVQGVTSFVSSRVCNEVKKPTVFTRTSAFTEWLSDVS